jgi:hypothetical protein
VSAIEIQQNWEFALEYYHGITRNLAMEFHPVRDWQIIGPFKSGEGLAGHDTTFAPEQGFDPNAEYDGAAGKVKWQPYRLDDRQLGIDFKSLFAPSEQVTAYALTYVKSPEEQTVQLRFGSNDSGKVWVGGKLVDDFNRESWCMLDRDIVTVTLPKGITPILCKATTGVGAWGITLRITDTNGDPARGLTFGYTAQSMDADDRPPLPKDLIFVRTAVDKQTLRIGESLVLSIQVWSLRSPRVNSGPARSSRIQYPSTDGFTVEDLEPVQFVANQGDFPYDVIEQRKRLTPIRNGTLTIGKFHWEGIALIDRTSVTARDKMYYSFDTKPIEITVTPTK